MRISENESVTERGIVLTISRLNRLRVATIPIIGLLVLGGAVPASAREFVPTGGETVAETVDEQLLNQVPAEVRDALVVAVETDVAEDVITAVTAVGEPVEIVVQRKPADEVVPTLSDDVPLVDPAAHTTEAPGVWAESIAAAPAPDIAWTTAAILVTETDAWSIYWPTGESFDASLDSETQRQGSASIPTPRLEVASESARLYDLQPGMEYQVQLTSVDGSTNQYVHVRTFDQGKEADERLVAPLAYQPYYQSYIHKTFIPDNRINVGLRCPDQQGYTFGGDNRGFRIPSYGEPWVAPDYRTMMLAHINWDNPAPYNFNLAKNVGETRVYNASGGLHASAYTSMDGMTFNYPWASSSFASITLQHQANDPLCTVFWGGINHAPPISYEETISFYRSGTTNVTGEATKAPSHEMYALFTSSTGSYEWWAEIARFPNEGFNCLIPLACGLPHMYNISAVS